ncbi:hypothetical protein AN964_13015 [Heyndrickxia shackletonii]|uniref:Cadherin-like beta-sandwich-like domain-containing protein n=1 Tax=Heyndrickxia shackletonii TaxID=157838 RepID=A0A0Q3TK01_9BACI|nr:cadherin-like beta sandwich domain-containing protein [Heyndrickxia shackletonii]KQL54320.1 hypothetical protein AN964_13015 [Heyndrickxia shackletonii]NEZ01457.1 cadherin-like beta sandwich domain-containing protein [Heyndrickxia shackletonii]
MQVKSLKIILAATVVSAGTYMYVPSSFADTVTNINESQIESANQLENLEIDGVKLDKAFSSNVLNYRATVENDVKNVTLHITANADEVITINGNKVEDPTNVTLNVNSGDNIFSIVVDDGINTPVTYTLSISRKLSSNNLLQNIKLSSGKLSKAFNSSVTEYEVEVPNKVESLTVTPEVFDAIERVKVNGRLLNQESATVKIPIGKSDITIDVTAENGESKKYILHVVRADDSVHEIPAKKPTVTNGSGRTNTGFPVMQTGQKNSGFLNNAQGTSSQKTGNQIKQSQAQLSSLSVSSGTWNKTFSRDEYTYHIAVGSSVKSVTIDAIPRTSGASVSIEGGESTIQLGDNAKKTIISIVVTKDDKRKTYVLVFDKDVKVKKTSNSIVTTNTSDNTGHTNNNVVTKNVKYANQNQTKQSTSWWGRLWREIKSWF